MFLHHPHLLFIFLSSKHVRCRCFDDWETAATFLRTERSCDLCGIVAQDRLSPAASTTAVASAAEAGSPGDAATAAVVTGSTHHGGTATENSEAASFGVMYTSTSRNSRTAPPAIEQCPTLPDDGSGDADNCDERISPPPPSPSPSPLPLPSVQPPPKQGDGDNDGVRGEKEGTGGSTGGRGRGDGNNSDRVSSNAAASSEAPTASIASTGSTAVRHRPFRRSTAFLVGHRNRLEDEALNACDFLVHVEQVS